MATRGENCNHGGDWPRTMMTVGCLLVAFASDRATGNDWLIDLFIALQTSSLCNAFPFKVYKLMFLWYSVMFMLCVLLLTNLGFVQCFSRPRLPPCLHACLLVFNIQLCLFYAGLYSAITSRIFPVPIQYAHICFALFNSTTWLAQLVERQSGRGFESQTGPTFRDLK